MDPHNTTTPSSVTCESHDEAVVHCLHALAYFSEHVASDSNGQDVAHGSAEFTPPLGWARESGQVTFRFSDARRRAVFLGEATRLLSGKWIRLELK